MNWSSLCNALAIALGAGLASAAQPLPPNADGTFRFTAPVYTLETSTNRLFRKEESPLDNPLPRETLPAQDDPESAWGPISGGYQLCLRFEKEVFQVGEPILASILVRNASDGFLGDAVGIPGSTQFFLSGERGQEVRAKLGLPPATKRRQFALWRGTQYKFKVPLSEFFELDRPGLYTVTVHKQVGESRAAPNVIMSGIATIRVVEAKRASATPERSGASGLPVTVRPIDSTPASSTGSAAGPSSVTSSFPGQTARVSPPGAAANAGSESSGDTASAEAKPPASSEKGRSILGSFAQPAKIAASVLVLLLGGAVLVFFAVRRARPRA